MSWRHGKNGQSLISNSSKNCLFPTEEPRHKEWYGDHLVCESISIEHQDFILKAVEFYLQHHPEERGEIE